MFIKRNANFSKKIEKNVVCNEKRRIFAPFKQNRIGAVVQFG